MASSIVSSSLIAKLRKMQERPVSREEETCDFCGKPIPEDHRHMVTIPEMRFMCACEMCTVIQAVHGACKIIPQRYELLHDFNLPEDLWSEFLIPVNMAFFVFNSNKNGIVAYYPAAAGATESKLKMEPWKKLQQLNPVLQKLQPDVEALLVNRLETPHQHFLVPIDCCYKLVGVIKTSWKGIFGGKEVQDATKEFFVYLKTKINNARPDF